MRCFVSCLSLLLFCLASPPLDAETADEARPIRALMITGGCCHDYDAQKKILSEGISARANVEWTIVHEGGDSRDHQVSIHKDRNWAEGYDVVLHNTCFGETRDVEYIHNITEVHKAGVPAVMIHCAMHSYRRADTEEYVKLIGVTSMNHGPHHPITVTNLAREHPIMKNLPGSWTTPLGELYNIEKEWETMTPLAKGVGRDSARVNTCIWINHYGEARVFGTTIGHHNETMQTEEYLTLVTNGLLWAVEKLAEDGTPQPGYEARPREATESQPQPEPTLADPPPAG